MATSRIRYDRLSTEQVNPVSRDLDRLPLRRAITLMNREDARVPRAVGRAAPAMERAIRLLTEALRRGGRLFFVGAGTSGRLGVLEAAECPPTFNTPPSLIQCLTAGGRAAVFRSQEGAEDRDSEARAGVRARVRRGDAVVGVAASGVTPYVRAALTEARRQGAGTVLVTCNRRGVTVRPDVLIRLEVGPEFLTGSTRLKSGSACKMALNMLTTLTMVRRGKVYGNRMVDLQPRSRKLRARAERLVTTLGRVSPQKARSLLAACGGRSKTAILMARTGLTAGAARQRLRETDGFLRNALGE